MFRIVLSLLVATTALGATVRAADGPAETPDAVVFLGRVGRGEGAPTKKSVGEFLVLSEVQRSDPYHEVVTILTKGERAEVLYLTVDGSARCSRSSRSTSRGSSPSSSGRSPST